VTVTNGLCQYNAIAIAHGRGAASIVTNAVIREIVDFMRNSEAMIASLAPRLAAEGRTFESYIDSVRNGAEGEEATLQAYANLHHVRIIVLSNLLICEGLGRGGPMLAVAIAPFDEDGVAIPGTLQEIVVIHKWPEYVHCQCLS